MTNLFNSQHVMNRAGLLLTFILKLNLSFNSQHVMNQAGLLLTFILKLNLSEMG